MADEPTNDTADPEADASASSIGDDTDRAGVETDGADDPGVTDPPHDHDHDESDDEDDDLADGSDNLPPWGPRRVFSHRNAGVIGVLSLHYPARTVDVFLDGDSALRMLSMFKRRHEGNLADGLDPYTSSAHAGWLVADLFDKPPMAMSWMPGLPSRVQHTAIDPPPMTS